MKLTEAALAAVIAAFCARGAWAQAAQSSAPVLPSAMESAASVSPLGRSEMEDKLNVMVGVYPELGFFTSYGPLGARHLYEDATSGFGASVQVMKGSYGAQFDLGYNLISHNPGNCTPRGCAPDLAITEPALLLDYVLDPDIRSGPYVYAMAGAGFNSVAATNASGYGTHSSIGPIFGIGVMILRPHPEHFFGDIEMRYTDYGNFGMSGANPLTSLMFLLKIGLRLDFPHSAP